MSAHFNLQEDTGFSVERRPRNMQSIDWKSLHEEIREKLKTEYLLEAMRTREKWLLERAIETAKESPSVESDNPVLREAEVELEIVRLKEELRNAQKMKNSNLIKSILRRIPASERYMSRLQQDIAEASSELARLERMEQLRGSILDMDMKTMSEMRRYHKPPRKVHEVMQAVMLLFKQDEETTTDWRVIQRQLNPHGPKGMNRSVLSFDPKDVHPAIAARVRQILESIDLEKMQMVSPGAATFYVWAMGVTEMVQTSNGKQEHPANILKQKEIFGTNIPRASPRGRRRRQPLGQRPMWQK